MKNHITLTQDWGFLVPSNFLFLAFNWDNFYAFRAFQLYIIWFWNIVHKVWLKTCYVDLFQWVYIVIWILFITVKRREKRKFCSMQNKNLNFPPIQQVKCSSSVKTKNVLICFDFCTYIMCRKIQILNLHGAKANQISVFLDLLTVPYWPGNSICLTCRIMIPYCKFISFFKNLLCKQSFNPKF